MTEIVNYEDLFTERDDPFQEELRQHDIENLKLMGYDLSHPKTEKNKKTQKKGVKVKKVSWVILPPGKHPFSKVMQYIMNLKKKRVFTANKKIDETRLKTIYQLSSDKTEVIVGVDKFNGYFIFTFPEIETFVLECPFHGNAIYVIKGNWQKVKTLSQLSKGEILSRSDTTRILHRGGWERKLRELLKK